MIQSLQEYIDSQHGSDSWLHRTDHFPKPYQWVHGRPHQTERENGSHLHCRDHAFR